MNRFAALLAVCALTLAGSTTSAADPEEAEFLASVDLAGMDAVGIIDYLDALLVEARPQDLMAVVRPDELVLTTPDEEISLAMPAASVYVSVAPFINQTHDCFYHSLTTCLGELRNAPVEVEIIEDGTGAVLVSEQATTFDNGFIGYWLPRDTAGTIEITHGEFTGYSYFTTGTDGATCITDLRLRASPLPQV